jgi:hypothetical protein
LASIARTMIVRFGMVAELSQVAYESNAAPMLGGQAFWRSHAYRDETAAAIDSALKVLVAQAFPLEIESKSRPDCDADQRRATLGRFYWILVRLQVTAICFSATASFATAAVIGSIGLLTIGRVSKWTEAPLAAVPLIFAMQQVIEGGLWVSMGGGLSVELPFANAFAVFALVLWPLWSPLATGLIEPNIRRRVLIGALFVAAIPLAVFDAMNIASHPYGACIVQHSLSYSNGQPYPNLVIAAYIACTCLPPILSSHRFLQLFGALLVVGLVSSTIFFLTAEFSVWCFFAALSSLAVYGCFRSLPASSVLATRSVPLP